MTSGSSARSSVRSATRARKGPRAGRRASAARERHASRAGGAPLPSMSTRAASGSAAQLEAEAGGVQAPVEGVEQHPVAHPGWIDLEAGRAKDVGGSGGGEVGVGEGGGHAWTARRAHDGVMASEIERKFLVPAVPSSLELGSGARLRQGYLAIDGPVEVRVRRSGDAAVLTVKAGSGLARTEVERDADRGGGRRALARDRGSPRGEGAVPRSRCRRATSSSVDVYEGALDGLVTAEVEFADADAADCVRRARLVRARAHRRRGVVECGPRRAGSALVG